MKGPFDTMGTCEAATAIVMNNQQLSITNLRLEFPSNFELVVNLIRSINGLKASLLKPYRLLRQTSGRTLSHHGAQTHAKIRTICSFLTSPSRTITAKHQHIPQLSAGIGFHNDCFSISDRTLAITITSTL